MQNPEFLKLLVNHNFLTAEDTGRLQSKYPDDDFAVLMELVKSHPAKKTFLCKLWGDSLGVAFLDIDNTVIQPEIFRKLSEDIARKNKIMPIYQFGDRITVATSDPKDRTMLMGVERAIGSLISPVFAWPDDIEDALEIYYSSGDLLTEFLKKIADHPLFNGTGTITEEQLKNFSGDRPVIDFTRSMMLLAMKERASDIHIEPGEDAVRIRFRIDGVLQERLQIENALLSPILTRLKIMANMDIAEKRRAQDGRITLTLPNRSVDLRVSVVPTIYGEKMVLRILGQVYRKRIPDLSELQFTASNLGVLKKIIAKPHGIFFATGPTGSGKTTTIYSILSHLNNPGINIMTVEDPIEYKLAGTNQVQVHPLIDLDFATVLRSFLRQDPDVILVGEIRDTETAKIAAQAALTGHLVLSTLHTNNAVQSVTRLIDLGVEPFLVAPSIIGVMAQRLVRRICEYCKEPYPLTPQQIDDLFLWDGKTKVVFYRGRGCAQCGNSGYKDRIAIHEVLIVDEETKSAVSRGASVLEIQKTALSKGLKTMRYDGLMKVLRGLTTIEEIDRVMVADEVF